MKSKLVIIGFILVVLMEIILLLVFGLRMPDLSQDTVAVNEIVQTVTQDFSKLEEHVNKTSLEYVVLDVNDKILFKTRDGLSESVNEATLHRDSIFNIFIHDEIVGKVIIHNDLMQKLQVQKQSVIIMGVVAIVFNCMICIGYVIYIHWRVVRPFYKLKSFAERVAGGNMDIPLEMDRHNLFGAFTESFDIMRSELKKARIAEAKANVSKKELVAKLSHDIKTPIASIKAVSEVGLAVAPNEKDKENYKQIIFKADQIDCLVTNLFTATLEELQQLSVSCSSIESKQIKKMLFNADYLNKTHIPEIPDCLLIADPLRLQQVFDNIFANSYKYANTKLIVSVEKFEKYVHIIIEDFGGGVCSSELPMLKEKYKRGSNAKDIDGAGLGLYICDYFMREMLGALIIENGEHGLKVTVRLALNGKI